MFDRVVRFFSAYDFIATIVLAICSAMALCYIGYRWLLNFYLTNAWFSFAFAGLGVLAAIAFVAWAIYYRHVTSLLILFVVLVFVAVPVFTTAGIDGFLP